MASPAEVRHTFADYSKINSEAQCRYARCSISSNFSIVNVVAGGLVPFLAGVLGGWFGEHQQAIV